MNIACALHLYCKCTRFILTCIARFFSLQFSSSPRTIHADTCIAYIHVETYTRGLIYINVWVHTQRKTEKRRVNFQIAQSRGRGGLVPPLVHQRQKLPPSALLFSRSQCTSVYVQAHHLPTLFTWAE